MTHGWAERDRGLIATAVICSMCGRRAYVRKAVETAIATSDTVHEVVAAAQYRCDGCGEPERNCYCPDARQLA